MPSKRVNTFMNNENWLTVFANKYSQLLDIRTSGAQRGLKEGIYQRSKGFQIIFETMFKNKNQNFNIIETGTIRKPNNWKDGNSGFLFAEFTKMHGGLVKSVDINQKAVDTANNFVNSKHYTAYCSDSVEWLKQQTNLDQIDLFYLDSYDVEWSNDEPSATHHLNEFLAIEPFLKNTVVAIDDNSFLLNGQRTGKGRKIFEYLEAKSVLPIYDAYQIIYVFNNL
jgi:hypothetical protein